MKGKKVILVEVITILLSSVLFFNVPIYAETYRYVIPDYSVNAFIFWYQYGFASLYSVSGDTVNLTISGTDTGNEQVDGYTNTTRMLRCNTSEYETSPGGYTSATTSCTVINSTTGTSYGYTATQANSSFSSNISLSGQLVENNYYEYYIPWLVSSNVPSWNSYTSNSRFYLYKDKPYYISFYSNVNSGNGQNFNFISASGVGVYQVSTIIDNASNNMYMKTYKIVRTDQSGWQTLNIPNFTGKSVRIIPIYNGTGEDLDDLTLQHIGLDSKTITEIKKSNTWLNTISQQVGSIYQKINEGSSEAQAAASAADSNNTQLQTQVSNMDQIESGYIDDLDSNFESIDINANTVLLTNDKFLATANWVSTQFTNLTYGNPIGSLLTFSFVLGLALILLGKIT